MLLEAPRWDGWHSGLIPLLIAQMPRSGGIINTTNLMSTEPGQVQLSDTHYRAPRSDGYELAWQPHDPVRWMVPFPGLPLKL